LFYNFLGACNSSSNGVSSEIDEHAPTVVEEPETVVIENGIYRQVAGNTIESCISQFGGDSEGIKVSF
jgi:hypothetical protein